MAQHKRRCANLYARSGLASPCPALGADIGSAATVPQLDASTVNTWQTSGPCLATVGRVTVLVQRPGVHGVSRRAASVAIARSRGGM
jgi:hypothetical protein